MAAVARVPPRDLRDRRTWLDQHNGVAPAEVTQNSGHANTMTTLTYDARVLADAREVDDEALLAVGPR